jgi:DNA-directed RNA polymerase subunit K/omega
MTIMNPFSAIAAREAVHDHFGLVVAAAARAHALKQGALPRAQAEETHPASLALTEIASGAWDAEDLAPYLAAPAEETKCIPHLN